MIEKLPCFIIMFSSIDLITDLELMGAYTYIRYISEAWESSSIPCETLENKIAERFKIDKERAYQLIMKLHNIGILRKHRDDKID